MVVDLNAYLQFQSEAREALEFYQQVFGGELDISTFGDYELNEDPADADLVMHGMLETDNGLAFMASDTPVGMEYSGIRGVSLALFGTLEDEVELRQYWDALTEGGQVQMPLEQAPWGDYFGQLVDRYGVNWMFDFGDPQEDD